MTLKVTPRAEHRRALRERALAADAENRLLRFKVAEYEREFDRAKEWITVNLPLPENGAKIIDVLIGGCRSGVAVMP